MSEDLRGSKRAITIARAYRNLFISQLVNTETTFSKLAAQRHWSGATKTPRTPAPSPPSPVARATANKGLGLPQVSEVCLQNGQELSELVRIHLAKQSAHASNLWQHLVTILCVRGTTFAQRKQV